MIDSGAMILAKKPSVLRVQFFHLGIKEVNIVVDSPSGATVKNSMRNTEIKKVVTRKKVDNLLEGFPCKGNQ